MNEDKELKVTVEPTNGLHSSKERTTAPREFAYKLPVQRTIDDFSYDKEKKIGEGTYGKVFKARDKKTNEIVALKQILISQKESGLPITSIREIKLLRSLRHENIVHLKEVILDSENNRRGDSESIYLVFEFMEHDLSGLNKLEGTRFVADQIRCYMHQLLEGLYHCHKKKILHRDIKGANMLINKDGVLKLADFGLARRMKDELGGRYTRPVVTLWYRSPELLLGTKTYSASIDMWSVGCLLAELYTGKPLFPGTSETDQIHRIYQLCGTPEKDNWPQGRELPAYKNFRPKESRRRKIRQYLNEYGNKNTITPETIDLIDQLLSLDPAKRPTAEGALDHAYFFSPPMTMTPANLPKYPGQLNELFSKRIRKGERPREQSGPPPKRYKDNEGRPHYRGPDSRDDFRRDRYRRDTYNHQDRRQDYRDRRQDYNRPRNHRPMNPHEHDNSHDRKYHQQPPSVEPRSPLAPVQPLPQRDYRDMEV